MSGDIVKLETRKLPNRMSKEKKTAKSTSESESEEDTSTIRCICNDNTDHGLMIQCEKCGVWQHSICVGIRGDKNVPKHYYCESCTVREFKCLCGKTDTPGKVIQCSTCPTWQHIRCLGRSTRALPKPYRCPNCDPTVMNHPTNLKPRKKKKGSSEFEFITSKELREEMEEDYFLVLQKNSKLDNIVPTKITDFRTVYIPNMSLLEKYFLKLSSPEEKEKIDLGDMLQGVSIILHCDQIIIRQCFEEIIRRIEGLESASSSTSTDQTKDSKNWKKGWSQITENQYASNLKPVSNSNDTEVAESSSTSNTDPAKQKSKILVTLPAQDFDSFDVRAIGDKWGLFLTAPVPANRFLIEFVGNVSDVNQVNYRSIPLSDRNFVLLRFDEELCVDARKNGNKSRFVRRSCSPNCCIKEEISNDQSRYGIYSSLDLETDNEITIDFNSPWKTSLDTLECACNKDSCPVRAWFKQRKQNIDQLAPLLKTSTPAVDTTTSDDTPAGDAPAAKKRRVDLSPDPAALNGIEDLKDLGREERKIAMLMKSFQKMENRQNRKRKASKDPDYKNAKKGREISDDESDQQDYSPPPSEPRSPVLSPKVTAPKPEPGKPGRKKRGPKPAQPVEEVNDVDTNGKNAEEETEETMSTRDVLKSKLKSRVKAAGKLAETKSDDAEMKLVEVDDAKSPKPVKTDPPQRKKPGRKPANKNLQAQAAALVEPVKVEPKPEPIPEKTNVRPNSPTVVSSPIIGSSSSTSTVEKTEPVKMSAKFGKKAWLQDYQEQTQTQSQPQSQAQTQITTSISSSISVEGPKALKKKMLDNFFTSNSGTDINNVSETPPTLTPSSSLSVLLGEAQREANGILNIDQISSKLLNQQSSVVTHEISIVSTTWTPKLQAEQNLNNNGTSNSSS